MKNVYHELTMLYLTNTINLQELDKPEQYAEAYFSTYYEIKAKYDELSRAAKESPNKNKRPDGIRR